MKLLLLFAALFYSAASLSAQGCNPVIYAPPACNQVTSAYTINDPDGGCYWICQGVTVNIDQSAGSGIFCEQNVILNINDSDGDMIYAKAGCVINNYSSQVIGVCGVPGKFTMNDFGGGMLVMACSCSTLTYDYSTIPGGGGACAGITGIDETKEVSFNVYPNPVKNGEVVNIQSADHVAGVVITDVAGKIIEVSTDNHSLITTTNLLPGIYLVKVEFSNGAIRMQELLVR